MSICSTSIQLWCREHETVFWNVLYDIYINELIDIILWNLIDFIECWCLTIFLNIKKGYKTKVITLPPTGSTLTTNKEILSILTNHVFQFKISFLWYFMILGEKYCFTNSETKRCKIFKNSMKVCLFCMLVNSTLNFSAIYRNIKVKAHWKFWQGCVFMELKGKWHQVIHKVINFY